MPPFFILIRSAAQAIYLSWQPLAGPRVQPYIAARRVRVVSRRHGQEIKAMDYITIVDTETDRAWESDG